MEFLPPPSSLVLTGNVAENWRKFKQRFEVYLEATGANVKSQKTQTSVLLHVIGEEAVEIYNTFTWDIVDRDQAVIADQNMILEHVLAKFDGYCTPRKNLVYEMHKFFTYKQQSGESMDQFVTELKARAKTCELGQLKDNLIMSQIVRGIGNNSLREKLLRVPELTLDKCIQLCKAAEIARVQVGEINNAASSASKATSEPAEDVHRVYKKKFDKPKYNPGKYGPGKKPQSTTQPKTKQTCRFCGYQHVFDRKSCPAYNKTCAKCQGRNHFASCCKNKRDTQKVDQVENFGDEFDEYFIDVIDNGSRDWIEVMKINDTLIPCKLDTGAQTNVMSKTDWDNLDIKSQIHPAKTKLKGYYNSDIPVLGKCIVSIVHRGTRYPVQFVVVPGTAPALLGRNACEKLDLVKRIHTVRIPSQILNEYQDLFAGLGCLPGEVDIKLRPDAEPVVQPCRTVPFQLREHMQVELTSMVKAGIITPVEEPTEWVHALHMVHKPNGKIRICLDPRHLNKWIKREHFKLPTREEIMSRFAGATVFSKLDATKGFWQLRLSEESSRLCTFITPIGRFRYLRLPFGVSSAPEIYHRKVHNMFADLEGVDTSMDDILVGGRTKEEHDCRLKQVLEICRANGLKLNEAKCSIGMKEVTFLGDVISAEGIKTDPTKVEAIARFPTPECRDDLVRFLGMVTYLGRFLPDLAFKTHNMRSLVKKDIVFMWTSTHTNEFELLKQTVSNAPVLQLYNPKLDTKISCDASKKGLGAILQQKHGDDWLAVAFGSRATTETESRYAPIERETLAIEFACTRFHQYIYGQTIDVDTDHKPLVAIFSKSLNDCPARIQRMRLKLQKYDLKLNHIPGKLMVTADALSRAPIKTAPDQECGQRSELENHAIVVVNTLACNPLQEEHDTSFTSEIERHCHTIVSMIPVSDRKRADIKIETDKDPVMQTLARTITEGWPKNRSDCPPRVVPFWNYRDELTVIDGLILKGSRIVIPAKLREDILDKLHQGHLGVEKCRSRARSSVFWPSINQSIQDKVAKCSVCLQYQPAQASEPLLPHETPSGPWEKIGLDLCYVGRTTYLVIVDYFSNFPDVFKLANDTSTAVIQAMKTCFSREGIPLEVFSDNGPCFSSREFRQFSELWDFCHSTSSPHFPQSNGKAESAVKIVKRILKKCQLTNEDPTMGLLIYRATPLSNGRSPAQLKNNGRNIRTNIPFISQNSSKDMPQADCKMKAKKYFDKKGVKDLKPLQVGQTVRYRSSNGQWVHKAVVVKKVAPRSYLLKTATGGSVRRNRRDIRVTTEPPTLQRSDSYSDLLDFEVEGQRNIPVPPPQGQNVPNVPMAPVRPVRNLRRPNRLIETM